jgi:chromosome transmission fidelity protein 1
LATDKKSKKKAMLEEKARNPYFRVIYATRTHSQIKEFLTEFKKTKFVNEFSALQLASRKNYCLNSKVNKTPNSTVLNERCQVERGSKEGCPYFDWTNIQNFKYELFPLKRYELEDEALRRKYKNTKRVADIEDLTDLAKEHNLCPYFATRENQIFADLVCMPYSSLLSEESRESLGLEELSRTIILFDESHNILETFASILSISLKYEELLDVIAKLELYIDRYRMRLSSTSMYFLKQILQIFKNFRKFFVDQHAHLKESTQAKHELEFTSTQILIELKCLDYDLRKLKLFIEESRLSQKLLFFGENNKKTDKKAQTEDGNADTGHINSSVEKIFSICLSLLSGFRSESTIIVEVNPKEILDTTFVYIPLDISAFFNSLINQSYAVLFTGGTMKPKGYLESVVSKGQKELKICQFTHVTEPDNIACSTLR